MDPFHAMGMTPAPGAPDEADGSSPIGLWAYFGPPEMEPRWTRDGPGCFWVGSER